MSQTTSKATAPDLQRREVVSKLLAQVPDALVVTGLGSASYDVFAAGDRDTNYYLWGAMGGAVPMGLGIALAQPQKQVVVITGDGEMLMGMGSLATVGVKQPRNLTIVVLDNGHYGETGMQRSHSSQGTRLAAVAQGCGIEDAFTVNTLEGVDEIARRIQAGKGVAFAQIIIDPDEPPRALPPRDGPYIKNRFRATLGLAPF